MELGLEGRLGGASDRNWNEEGKNRSLGLEIED